MLNSSESEIYKVALRAQGLTDYVLNPRLLIKTTTEIMNVFKEALRPFNYYTFLTFISLSQRNR